MARNVNDTSATPRRRGRPRKDGGNGIGHNSSGDGMINASALAVHVDRLLSLHADRAEINADIKEVYEDAKAAGIVPKILRKLIAEKLMDEEVRLTQYRLMDSYRSALGLLADTPLGQAAMQSAPIATGFLGTAE